MQYYTNFINLCLYMFLYYNTNVLPLRHQILLKTVNKNPEPFHVSYVSNSTLNLTFMNPCIVIQLWTQPTRCNYIG